MAPNVKFLREKSGKMRLVLERFSWYSFIKFLRERERERTTCHRELPFFLAIPWKEPEKRKEIKKKKKQSCWTCGRSSSFWFPWCCVRPHRKLMKLEITGYGGLTFPTWMAHESFHDTVEPRLRKCGNCCLLPPFGQLPSLKELEIERMECLVSIGDEICDTPLTKSFPSLEILHIHSMDLLEKWCRSIFELERRPMRLGPQRITWAICLGVSMDS